MHIPTSSVGQMYYSYPEDQLFRGPRPYSERERKKLVVLCLRCPLNDIVVW